ncbi:hypothetical protein MMC12_005967 [Toensbergia leucococca]|nr:hypothetical protein [Toensbergia leucococca]
MHIFTTSLLLSLAVAANTRAIPISPNDAAAVNSRDASEPGIASDIIQRDEELENMIDGLNDWADPFAKRDEELENMIDGLNDWATEPFAKRAAVKDATVKRVDAATGLVERAKEELKLDNMIAGLNEWAELSERKAAPAAMVDVKARMEERSNESIDNMVEGLDSWSKLFARKVAASRRHAKDLKPLLVSAPQ